MAKMKKHIKQYIRPKFKSLYAEDCTITHNQKTQLYVLKNKESFVFSGPSSESCKNIAAQRHDIKHASWKTL